MSKSTQLKRKKLDRVSNQYESDGETIYRPNKSIRNNSLRLGNDLESTEDEEDSGIYLLIQFIDKPDQYDIVPDKSVTLSQNDSSLGFVKHYSKLYKVKIIKKGTHEFVMRKAERFKFNLSLKTSDENETENQLNVLKKNKKDEIEKSTFKENVSPVVVPTIMDVVGEPRIQTISRIDISKINPNNDNKIDKDIFEAFKREMEEKLKKQKEDFDNLLEEVKLISPPADAKLFVYNGTDLIKEVSGHPAHIWTANCCKILFTEDECKNSVLVPSNKTQRQACSPNRVKLLREAFAYKYKYPEDKNEKIWKIITEAFNTKGRRKRFDLQKAKNFFQEKIIGTTSKKSN